MNISYDNLKNQSIANGALDKNPTDGGSTGNVNVIQATVTLPKITFLMEDATFGTDLAGERKDLNSLLGIKPGNNGRINNYAGSQVLINSDRLILNSRLDYLMLFGQQGIAISSPGNINIDSDDAITMYGEDGVFIGVPGKGKSLEEGGGNTKAPKTKAEPTLDMDYEPLVLGSKVASLLEDLLVVLKNATILTSVGKAYFREDTMYDLACLQARIPEMLSTYGYIDGLSHEAPDPGPEPLKTTTEASVTTVGSVVGSFEGVTEAKDPNTVSDNISKPLANQTDFFETVTLYNDPINI